MYRNIIDPISQKKVDINSNKGLKILKKYLLYGGTKIGLKIVFNDTLTAITNGKPIPSKSKSPSKEVGTQVFKNPQQKSVTLFYKKLNEHEYHTIINKGLLQKWKDSNLIESVAIDLGEYQKEDEDDELNGKIVYIKNVDYILSDRRRITDINSINTNIWKLYTDLSLLLDRYKLIYLDIKLQNIGCLNESWIFIDNESTIPDEDGIFLVPDYFYNFYSFIPYDTIDKGFFNITDFYHDKDMKSIKDDFKIKALYILLLLIVVVQIYTGTIIELRRVRGNQYLSRFSDLLNQLPDFWQNMYQKFTKFEQLNPDEHPNFDEKWKDIVKDFEMNIPKTVPEISRNRSDSPEQKQTREDTRRTRSRSNSLER